MHLTHLIPRGGFSPITFAKPVRLWNRFWMVLAAGLLASTGWAADNDARPQGPTAGLRQQLLEKFDADKNGQLDETEWAKAKEAMAQRRRGGGAPGAARAELVKRFDKDGDGRLNEQERQAAIKAAGGLGQRPDGNPAAAPLDRREIMKRFDKNGDGRLDEAERTAARASFANRPGTPAGRTDGARPGGEFMKRFDKNGDGKLDETERAAAQAAFANRPGFGRPATAGDAAPAAAKPDTGRVDKKALLKEFDADGDGKLTGDERAAARQAFQERKAKKEGQPQAAKE